MLQSHHCKFMDKASDCRNRLCILLSFEVSVSIVILLFFWEDFVTLTPLHSADCLNSFFILTW